MPNGKGLYGRARGSVRTSPRGSIDFAEGQYVLFAVAIPKKRPRNRTLKNSGSYRRI